MSVSFAHFILAFCQFTLALVFALSFFGKVRGVSQFAHTIMEFRILPPRLHTPAAWLLLLAEGIVVTLLALGGQLLTAGFILALVLLLMFSAALLSVLWRRMHTPCNCFGIRSAAVSMVDVLRNVGLALCAVVGTVGAAQLQPLLLGIAEWLVVMLGSLLFLAIWLQLGELAQLFRAKSPRV